MVTVLKPIKNTQEMKTTEEKKVNCSEIYKIYAGKLHYYGSKINTRRRSSNYSSRSSDEKNGKRSGIDDFNYL